MVQQVKELVANPANPCSIPRHPMVERADKLSSDLHICSYPSNKLIQF